METLVGSEISGQRDFYHLRSGKDDFADEVNALSMFEFTSVVLRKSIKVEKEKIEIPDVLLKLVSIFRSDEASCAFRFPTERISVSREKQYKTYHAPIMNLPKEGLLIGTGEHPSYQGNIPIYITPKDRKRHMYIVGQTGTGKSKMIQGMLKQDLRSNGVCVIDPHGDLLVDDVFACIPEERKDDVYLFDPSDPEYVFGFNFLETTSGAAEEKDYIVQELISVLCRLVDWEIQLYGPMAQQWTRYSCMTLMDLPEGGTLLDVPRLFSDDEFREDVLKRIKNPEISLWWENEFAKMSSEQKNEMLGYFTSKFTPYVSGPQMRKVLGQRKSTINFQDIIDQKKILLVNLAKGKLGQINSELLGSLILSRLLWAIMRRAWKTEEERREFYLYIDEFHNFLTDSFEPMFSETRKYGLNIVIAHQHLAQLNSMFKLADKVKQAIFGNVGTLICFRVGIADASTLASELGPPVDAETLRNLENRYAAAKLLVNGAPTVSFTLRTLDWKQPTKEELARGQRIKNAARCRNKSVSQVESEIRT